MLVCCPRCGGDMMAPNLMRAEWTCPQCGPVPPLHIAERVNRDVLAGVTRSMTRGMNSGDLTEVVPLWCPWPLPSGWMVTGVAWAGDERGGARASALALAGPAPLTEGPADVVFIAEQLGVGLGASLIGLRGPDPGPALREAVQTTPAHAKVKAAGHPTPLWAVKSLEDRSAYVGEARGMWLYAVSWPAQAGYLLAEEILLHDLIESLPSELVYGAPTRRLRPGPPRD